MTPKFKKKKKSEKIICKKEKLQIELLRNGKIYNKIIYSTVITS